MGVLHVLVLLTRVLVSLAAVLLMCWLLRSHLIGPFYRKLHAESKGNKEILVLGTSAFVFLMLTVSVSFSLGVTVFSVVSNITYCCHTLGDRIYGCVYGVGMLPGWSAALIARSHGHS